MASREHEDLKERARAKLEKLGYKVTSVPSQMKQVFAKKGYTLRDIGHPDLCATKDDEVHACMHAYVKCILLIRARILGISSP
jgi:hypothetical protein